MVFSDAFRQGLGCVLMQDGISGNGLCSKDLETLFVWENISNIHGPQELKVSLYPKRVEFETKDVVGINKGL